MRRAFARLAHEQIIECPPKRGAFVARPSIDQARDVFDARGVIEPAVVRRLSARATEGDIRRLRAHIAMELDAVSRGDKATVIRLSGEFHDLLAELAGNSAFVESIRRLSALTCLVILLYEAPTSVACRAHDHSLIVDAVERGDADLAVTQMQHHLQEIERNVDLSDTVNEVDLEQVFSL